MPVEKVDLMIIEHYNGSFNNKGAQLMLWAVIQHLRTVFPDVKIVAEPQIGTYAQRASYGLYQKMHESRYGRTGWMIDLLMHNGYREKFGLIADREIDAVLDSSGFLYGDQWGAQSMERRAAVGRRWKKQGKKIVFLPQAMGPFQNPQVRAQAREIFECADLIFARDRESFVHLRELGFDRVEQAPDITHLVKGVIPDGFAPPQPWACVIPNRQMIKMSPGKASDQYLEFMVTMIKELTARNLHPHILQHDVRDDTDLVRQINNKLGAPVPVIKEENPVCLKGIIGNSFLVVVSRFHGLVNALSQAVPAIATSWSHKYRELLTDYGCPENLLATDVLPADIAAAIDRLTREPTRSRLVNKLTDAAALQKEKVVKMWSQVDSLLAG